VEYPNLLWKGQYNKLFHLKNSKKEKNGLSKNDRFNIITFSLESSYFLVLTPFYNTLSGCLFLTFRIRDKNTRISKGNLSHVGPPIQPYFLKQASKMSDDKVLLK
jgi:hypothetical protein